MSKTYPYFKLIRVGNKDYDWTNFPSRIDLVAIYRVNKRNAHVYSRQKPYSDNEFLSHLMTIAQDTVRVAVESVDLCLPICNDNACQTIIKLVGLSYGVIKYPSTVVVQNIANSELRQAILELNEYKNLKRQLMTNKQITQTMIALMKYAKDPQVKEFTFDGLKEVLGPIYSYHMREVDVIRVLLKHYLQMTQIYEFEMSNRFSVADMVDALIFSPINSVMNYPNKVTFKDSVTVELFYTRILQCMLNDIMMAKIDWCREILYPEESQSTTS